MHNLDGNKCDILSLNLWKIVLVELYSSYIGTDAICASIRR